MTPPARGGSLPQMEEFKNLGVWTDLGLSNEGVALVKKELASPMVVRRES